jgi:hypothetical protein
MQREDSLWGVASTTPWFEDFLTRALYAIQDEGSKRSAGPGILAGEAPKDEAVACPTIVVCTHQQECYRKNLRFRDVAREPLAVLLGQEELWRVQRQRS